MGYITITYTTIEVSSAINNAYILVSNTQTNTAIIG